MELGATVKFDGSDGTELTGTVVRIVKVTKPFGPETTDATKWAFHVHCAHEHPRYGGIYQLGLIHLR